MLGVKTALLALATILAWPVSAEMLPGFRLEKMAGTKGFLTSIAFDSAGRLHYSVTAGKVFRIDDAESVEVARVDTASEGNAALLGIAFRGENEIVFHYVKSDLSADVIEVRNTATGEPVERHELVCNEGRECSTEHHGGNPIVAPDGAIFVGIGDLGYGNTAQDRNGPGGKIFRIPSGSDPAVYAIGFRNPFDLVFHPSTGKLIIADNGSIGDDEISFIKEGDNGGWPLTMGNQLPVEGTVAPVFNFAETVAPTGAILNGDALILGSFVSKALFYFHDLSSNPLAQPVEIFREDVGPVIDVAQNSKGEVFVGAAMAVYRLIFPQPGDADGNGRIDAKDFDAIAREILDTYSNETVYAHLGSFRATWGADVNLDGIIDARDLVALAKLRHPRNRAVRP